MTELVDKNGNTFDPDIHKVKKDGAPAKNNKGELVLLPVGGVEEVTCTTEIVNVEDLPKETVESVETEVLVEASKLKVLEDKIVAKPAFNAEAFAKSLNLALVAEDEWSITVKANGVDICVGKKQGEDAMRKVLRNRGV